MEKEFGWFEGAKENARKFDNAVEENARKYDADLQVAETDNED